MKLRRILPFIIVFAVIAGLVPASADAPAVKRLALQAPSKELVVGKDGLSSMLMIVKATPADADLSGLEWTSSKPRVATVDGNGYVTAHAGGSVNIVVTDTLTNKRASKSVKVWELPSGVEMRHTEKTLKAGRAFTLSAKLTPTSNIRKTDKALSWFSSDPAVATVNARGRVTAVSPGQAVVTVMTVNGRTDECVITVT